MALRAAGLVSIGDHFDFPAPAVESAERAGREILSWLAAHPPDQVVILAGNHDVARVMDLATETDESFADARTMAEEIHRAPRDRQDALTKAFGERFPAIPTPDIARRDYSSFSVAQRALVQRLLLERRLSPRGLTAPGGLGGRRRLCCNKVMRRRLRVSPNIRNITVDGVTDSIAGWAIRCGITAGAIYSRLRRGLSEREAVTTPSEKPRTGRPRYRRER